MTVGDRIRLRRIELGMTQEELAKRMGYETRSAVCRIEKKKNDISTRNVKKYAEVLNCSASYLMGWSIDESAMSMINTDELMDLLTAENIKLMKMINSLNDDHQAAILEQVEFFMAKEKKH